MSNITVWTKQHENVLKELETTGRYIAKREYIRSIRYGCHLPTKEQ